jgi:hypothetical protein
VSPNSGEEFALKFPRELPYAEYVSTDNGSYVKPISGNGTQTELTQVDKMHHVNMDAKADPVQHLERSGTDKSVQDFFEDAGGHVPISSQDGPYNPALTANVTPISAQP